LGKEDSTMGKKVAMLGAGSVVFCKMLVADIMATPAQAILKRFIQLVEQKTD